jgi:hypothetical protein
MIKGLRIHSDLYKKQVQKIVSEQARGFLLASFAGGFVGGIAGAVFSFGLGAVLF